MAIAIIPINQKPDSDRSNWLSMNKADEMVCELFGVEPDPEHYCHNWFNAFWYFDWFSVKKFFNFESNYAFDGFKTADDAILYFFQKSIYLDKDRTLWESVEVAKEYVSVHIEPIIRMFYDNGYKIVSLNIG